jgi:hypothetical protein
MQCAMLPPVSYLVSSEHMRSMNEKGRFDFYSHETARGSAALDTAIKYASSQICPRFDSCWGLPSAPRLCATRESVWTWLIVARRLGC